MKDIIQALTSSPALALLGAALLLTVLLAPIALRIAGLTGHEIIETLRLTLQFFTGIVQAFREEKKNGKADKN